MTEKTFTTKFWTNSGAWAISIIISLIIHIIIAFKFEPNATPNYFEIVGWFTSLAGGIYAIMVVLFITMCLIIGIFKLIESGSKG